MAKAPAVTIRQLLDLRKYENEYRFGLGGKEKTRPPEFRKLVEFIERHFAGHLTVKVQPWTYTPTRKVGRLISYTGKKRHGFRLEVFRPQDPPFHPFWYHVTCETYRSNWDIIREIVEWHRKIRKDGNLKHMGEE